MKINEYLCSRRGYKKPKISTIVDEAGLLHPGQGYKKPKISTIVDMLQRYKEFSKAIRSQKFLLL